MKLKFDTDTSAHGSADVLHTCLPPIRPKVRSGCYLDKCFTRIVRPHVAEMFRLLKAHQCTLAWVVWVAVEQVLKGHLLKAGQLFPLRGGAHRFEGERSVEDVSDKLTACSFECVHLNWV